MVTTRASTKSTANSADALPVKSKIVALPTTSKKKKQNTEDVPDDREVDVLPAEQHNEVFAAIPRKVTGKRKRASGAREVSNVSSLSKDEPNDSQPRPFSEDVARPSFDVEGFKTFVQLLKDHAHCGNCGKNIEKGLDVQSFVEAHCPPPLEASSKSPVTATSVLSATYCPSNFCAGITCIGCGYDINTSSKAEPHNHSLYGCQRGWYVALWMQLAYAGSARAPPPQDQYTDAYSSRSSANSTHSKSSRHKPTPAGTGYASGNPSINERDDNKARSEAAEKEKVIDQRDGMSFSVIAYLMKNKPADTDLLSADVEDAVEGQPVRKRARTSRRSQTLVKNSPAACAQDHILPSLFNWSGVLQALARLFRNDSLEEAMRRREVYEAALDLVEALLGSDTTARLVTERTYNANKAVPSVPHSTFTAFPILIKSYDDEVSIIGPVSTSREFDGPSVADSMDNILVACDTLSAAAKNMPKVYKDKSSQDVLQFASRFQEIGKRLGKSTSVPSRTASAVLPQATSSDSRFEMVEEADITKRYMRPKDSNFKMSSSGTAPRMRALHREVGMLRTSLPPGIWVKMASSRPDMIKALIVGPEGTPYEGGLFEFDIFCPKDYPRVPPKVECATAARDEARQFSLNPNLYNNGYVCLSVINTWHGAKQEQWQPSKSTLLQVLISIQSMVLGTATPADNEPGGLGLSHRDYNCSVHPGTIKAALLPWLMADELRKGIWRNEVESYFKVNATHILDTVRGWARDNKRITAYLAYPYSHAPMPANAFLQPPPPLPAVPSTNAPEAQASAGVTAPGATGYSAPSSSNTAPGTEPSHAINAPPPSNLPSLPPGMPVGMETLLGDYGVDSGDEDFPPPPPGGTNAPPSMPPPGSAIPTGWDAPMSVPEYIAKRAGGAYKVPEPVDLLKELEKALNDFL